MNALAGANSLRFARLAPVSTGGVWTSLLVAATIALLLLAPAQAVELMLRETASIKAKNIFLGDLLESKSGVPPALLAVPLGQTPPYNDVRIINRGIIEAAIKKHAPHITSFTWLGADSCKVDRPTRLVTTPDLIAVILPALQHATQNNGIVNVLEVFSSAPMQIPLGRAQGEVELAPGALTSENTQAMITFIVEGERVLTRSVRFRWAWQVDGWVANRALQPGAPLTTENFTLTKVDALKGARDLITSEMLSSEHTLKRAMQPGQVLTQQHVELRRIVFRGGQVLIHYDTGGIRVTVAGVALQDGTRGSTIEVMNTQSRKKMLARVRDDRNLEFVQTL